MQPYSKFIPFTASNQTLGKFCKKIKTGTGHLSSLSRNASSYLVKFIAKCDAKTTTAKNGE